ncbi:hypothetical protein J5226_04465 [Lysobacter sp. K5869]|uniref:hypothetical protein n=1 Tax=Lysobacter sp. K5869 TaxID=2820808 RepID=UPI001C05F1D1|nr:hypothetical protein [Lysobacter sp. K5869]QWP77671.1 hypothetical protein J5226_04465 [Lysobacter sp. K5869]
MALRHGNLISRSGSVADATKKRNKMFTLANLLIFKDINGLNATGIQQDSLRIALNAAKYWLLCWLDLLDL